MADTITKKVIPKRVRSHKPDENPKSDEIPKTQIKFMKEPIPDKIQNNDSDSDLDEMNVTIDTKQRKRRMVNYETFRQTIKHANDILDMELTRKAREREGGARPIRKVKKLLERIEMDVPKIAKKPRKPNSKPRVHGFTTQKQLKPELTEFLNIPRDSRLHQNEIRCALRMYIYKNPNETRDHMLRWNYLNTCNRDLRDPQNLHRIIPDDKLSKLLKYPEYCQRVRDGLEFENKLNKMTNENEKVPANTDLLDYKIMKLIQQLFVTDE